MHMVMLFEVLSKIGAFFIRQSQRNGCESTWLLSLVIKKMKRDFEFYDCWMCRWVEEFRSVTLLNLKDFTEQLISLNLLDFVEKCFTWTVREGLGGSESSTYLQFFSYFIMKKFVFQVNIPRSFNPTKGNFQG